MRTQRSRSCGRRSTNPERPEPLTAGSQERGVVERWTPGANSLAVEHSLHTRGVAGSIPASPKFGAPPYVGGAFVSMLLALVRSDIAAARVPLIRPRHASLVGLQQVARPVSAAATIASVDCGASEEQRHRPCRASVVVQKSESRMNTVQVAGAVEIARPVAAQVEALRRERSPAAILRGVVRDDAVLQVGGRPK